MHKISLLGAGLIGRFYTMSLLGYRGKDEVKVVNCRADTWLLLGWLAPGWRRRWWLE